VSGVSETAAARTTYREVFAASECRVVFAAHLLRVLAASAEILGLSVLIYSHTGSPLLGALAFGVGMIPQALGGALLTSLADRLPPRALLVASLLVRALPGALIGLLVLPIGAMFALVAIAACLDPLAAAALGGLLPELLDGDRYVLGRSVLNMTASGAQIAGLGVGGVLLLALSARQVLLAAAVALVLAAIAVRLGLERRLARAVGHHGGTVRATLRGNCLLLADRGVRGLLLAQWLPAWLVTAAEALIVPYIGALGRPEGTASALLVAMPVGMLAGEAVIGRFCAPRTRERLTLPLAAGMGLPLLGFVALPPIPVAAMLILATGFGFGYELGIERSFLDALPTGAQGQAFGLRSTGLMTGQGLGPAAAGAVAGALGPGPTMAIAGGCCVAAALALRGALTPGDTALHRSCRYGRGNGRNAR
jgi:predicted MFS family arabinose efflux permease